jgi:hypothetical protein
MWCIISSKKYAIFCGGRSHTNVALGMIPVTNEPLELGMQKFAWKYL